MRHSQPPSVETMRLVQSYELWKEANLEAPLRVDNAVYEAIRSQPGAHPDDLLDLPGVRVKAMYEPRTSYRHFGKLVKFRGEPWEVTGYGQVADEVVVMSVRDALTLWLGTVEEYHAMWCVD